MGIIVLKMKKDNIIVDGNLYQQYFHLSDLYITFVLQEECEARWLNRDPVIGHLHTRKNKA